MDLYILNVNSDRRVAGDVQNAVPECHINKRLPLILDYLTNKFDTNKEVVVSLFEVSAQPKEELMLWAKNNKLYCVTAAYANSVESFHFVVMSNRPFANHKVFPFTKSCDYYQGIRGENLDETLFDKFEKSVFCVLTSSNIHIWTTHLSLPNQPKKLQVEMLARLTQTSPFSCDTKDECHILVGDFNCFDHSK